MGCSSFGRDIIIADVGPSLPGLSPLASLPVGVVNMSRGFDHKKKLKNVT